MKKLPKKFDIMSVNVRANEVIINLNSNPKFSKGIYEERDEEDKIKKVVKKLLEKEKLSHYNISVSVIPDARKQNIYYGEFAKGGKTQGYNARLDESLGSRTGRGKSQSYKSRRDESKGTEKSMGKRPYSSVGTMDFEL